MEVLFKNSTDCDLPGYLISHSDFFFGGGERSDIKEYPDNPHVLQELQVAIVTNLKQITLYSVSNIQKCVCRHIGTSVRLYNDICRNQFDALCYLQVPLMDGTSSDAMYNLLTTIYICLPAIQIQTVELNFHEAHICPQKGSKTMSGHALWTLGRIFSSPKNCSFSIKYHIMSFTYPV